MLTASWSFRLSPVKTRSGPIRSVSRARDQLGVAGDQHRVRMDVSLASPPNVVSLGPVETPILADFEATIGREALDAARGFVGRHASVDDVVPVNEFLASAQARWVNGQDIQVDGGYIAAMLVGMPAQSINSDK
jgi:Enoyl-(Acyl carrier protein) reductase